MNVLDFPRGELIGNESVVADDTVTDEPSSASVRSPASSQTCLHRRLPIGSLTLDLCPTSSTGRWLSAGDELDPAEALAQLFGTFDLVGAVAGIGTPGDSVLLYAPDSRRGRSRMRAMPAGEWVEAAPSLWLTHDGVHLFMSPEDPLLADNLTRDL